MPINISFFLRALLFLLSVSLAAVVAVRVGETMMRMAIVMMTMTMMNTVMVTATGAVIVVIITTGVEKGWKQAV